TLVQLGTNGPSGRLPAGGVINNGTLLFNTSSNFTYGDVISGNGNLTNVGAARITLNAANTFTGTVAVVSNVMRAGNAAAFGARGNTLVVNAGAQLDLNSQDLTRTLVVAQGTGITNGGAIINLGGTQNPAFTNVTLLADTTFGGTGRWDIRSAIDGQ